MLNFLVIRPEDISIFQYLFADSARDANWYTCSLESFGLLLKSQSQGVHCLSGPPAMHIDERRLELDFDILARDLDQLCSNIRQESGLVHGESRGWDYLYFYFLLNCYARYEVMSHMLASLLPQGETYHMLMPNVSPDYHLDSSCYRNVLLTNLTKFDIKIVNYGNSRLTAREEIYESSYSLDILSGDPRTVISVPALLHPRPQDRHLIAELAGNSIDFQSPVFDVPVSERRALLLKKGGATDGQLENYKTLLDWHLLPVLMRVCPKFTARSFKRVCDRANFQARFNYLLFDNQRLESIRQLVITNHDGGIQGPLLTWAAQRNLKVTVLPHSALDNIPLPRLHAEASFDGLLLSPPSYLNRINDFSLMAGSHYNQGICADSSRFERFINSNRYSGLRLLLVHNSLDDYAYFPAENIQDYIQSIRLFDSVVDICELRHRFKPGKQSRHLFSKALSIDDKNKALEWANVVVGLGQPSSFLFECALNGKFTVHVCSKPLGHKSRQLLHESTFIACRTSLLEGTNYIISLMRSSVS